MGAPIPKQYIELDGSTILRRTVAALASMPRVTQFIVACAPEYASLIKSELAGISAGDVDIFTVDGGPQRQDSVRNALTDPRLSGDLVAIHDAVRPNVTQALMDRVCAAAERSGAAIPAIRAMDTVKRSAAGVHVDETLPRQEIWLAQTPQVFDRELICLAHQRALLDGFDGTDDASLAEHMGVNVELVEGDPFNVKITRPEDLRYLSTVMGTSTLPDIRIGYGYDVHRLEAGRKLILGGIDIPFEKGLKGHSDADALLHAITDAIIGALALGDIGSHFPDNDPANKDLDSRIFLRKAVQLAAERGYTACNVDCTVVAERPKLRVYIDRMREVIATDMSIELDRVSVKATTSEAMGFVGRGEGMAAMATVLLQRGG